MRKNVFTPVIAAAVLVLFAGSMAIRMGFAGANFVPSLNTDKPALSQAEPFLVPAGKRMTRRVILVIIDGLRLKESYQIEYLNRLRKQGIDAKAQSQYPTFSRPNHINLVTGVPPRWSGVRSNDYDTQVHLDTLMDRARAKGMRSSFVADYSNGLPVMCSEHVGNTWHNDFHDIHYIAWPGGFVAASRLSVDRGNAFVVLLPGYVDDAGHEYGGDSPEYRAAAQRAGRDLERALGTVDLRYDTVIVTADHGHTDGGGHGGTEPVVLNVPLILAGKGIRAGSSIVDAKLQDVAPTIAALLGLPAPGHALGRTLTEALTLTKQQRAWFARNDRQRIERNQLIDDKWETIANAERHNRRVWRLPVVLIVAALGIGLVIFGVRISALKLDWRVLMITLPAFPVTYYLVLGLFGQNFSPSVIPARGSVVGKLFRFGLVSTAAHVVACWWALRGGVVLRERLAAANGLTMVGLFSALVPAGLAWAWYPGPHVQLPTEGMLVIIPGTFVAVACYAMAVSVTLGLEIVVFFARAVDPRVRLRRLERAAAKVREHIESQGDTAEPVAQPYPGVTDDSPDDSTER